ncbi:MAG TPA: hypothetical protein VIN07_06505 [Flavipsychrobacter sp.]
MPVTDRMTWFVTGHPLEDLRQWGVTQVARWKTCASGAEQSLRGI